MLLVFAQKNSQDQFVMDAVPQRDQGPSKGRHHAPILKCKQQLIFIDSQFFHKIFIQF